MTTPQQQEAMTDLFTLRDFIRFGASRFNEAGLFYGHGTDNAWDEALVLALFSLHLDIELGNKILDGRLTSTEKNKILALYDERIVKRIPAPYLTHQAFFAGLTFYVDNRVLIPRSPIAELIENHFEPWIDSHSVTRILDMGTGSGCIAIAAAYAFRDAYVLGIDNSEAALDVARLNVKNHQLENKVALRNSDLFTAIKDETFDVIVANPPYVDAEDMANLPREYLHEPRTALAAGLHGLDYAITIVNESAKHLSPHGILILEVGNSAEALRKEFPKLASTWVGFQHGGDGVCVITRAQLNQIIGN
jgi:ribosomal protein L3 glutamine methyltransferase